MQVHMDSLQSFIASRRADGVKTATINLSLAVVRRIVNLAASEWRDVRGMTWLERAAKIKLLPVKDARPAYPLSREEQAAPFQELPDPLAEIRTEIRASIVKERASGDRAWSSATDLATGRSARPVGRPRKSGV
jgi:hypothetical protein